VANAKRVIAQLKNECGRLSICYASYIKDSKRQINELEERVFYLPHLIENATRSERNTKEAGVMVEMTGCMLFSFSFFKKNLVICGRSCDSIIKNLNENH